MTLWEEILSSAATSAIGALCGYIYKLKKDHAEEKAQQEKENALIKAGLQALLRDRLIQGYNHYVLEKGWIPIYAKDSLMNVDKIYEGLGENGVMNDLVEAIRRLPNYDPAEKKEGE